MSGRMLSLMLIRRGGRVPMFAAFAMAVCMLGGVPRALACSVPVFRYALDRWPAESYELRVDRGAAAMPAIAPLLEKLRTNSLANVTVQTSSFTGAATAKLMFPDPPGGEVWAGSLSAASLEQALDSPVRREIGRRIANGDSAVWVLVESGNGAVDDGVANALERRLKHWMSAASLPEQDPNDPTSQIGPGPALALRFSVLRLSRKDPREAVTLAMFEANSDEIRRLRSVPVVFPVFGRGRVLAAVPKENLTNEGIDDVCAFISGACSCQVKDSRTGWDLLLSFNWDEELARVEEQRRNGATTAQPVAATHQGGAQPALRPETVTIRGEPVADGAPPAQGWHAWIAVALVLAGVGGIAWAGWNRKKT